MSSELYACVCAVEFPAQALLRLRTDLQAQPVAVLDGPALEEIVCSLNRHAVQRGAALGMTRLEAEGIGGLQLLSRSVEVETAAHAVLLECAAKFSPRIEEVSHRTVCTLVLDITGTELLFGPPVKLAARLRDEMAAAGFRVSIAVSANFHATRIKATTTRGITIIPAGEEARVLEKLPIASLVLTEEHKETFALWGIRTLGELAALPEVELVKRLGAVASDWRTLAHGVARHTFQPIEPEFALKEFYDFETPVEQLDSLLFIGARMIDCLVARAAGRALSLASLTADMELEGRRFHHLAIHPAVPTVDRKFLLKLLQLEMGVHPPLAAVVSLTLTAEAGRSNKMQLGLFAPQTPEPSRLDVTLARLKAIVGEDRVGTPVLEDTHRPGSFRMEGFVVDAKPSTPEAKCPRMALRRVRPPHPIQVSLHAMKPVAFRDGDNRFDIVTAYGPWRTSGCWWSQDRWDTEEWDALVSSRSGEAFDCLLVQDRLRDEWWLEAFYD
ncbi:MAG: DNA polymerase Y family protein [Terracidiphilus sp.]|nr:DNA polymerase Y family protein [Terracidiphilus sp.]